MSGTIALTRAEIARFRNNRRYLIFTVLLPVMFYLIFAKENDTTGGVSFAAFYMIGMASFGALSSALNNNAMRMSQEKKDGWIRQLRLTPLPANGYVMDYYWAGSYGNRLVIDHGIIYGRHVVTSFNHLSAGLVGPGASVSQGDSIALVGTTGDSTGCHLHYMIWMDGQNVDPTPYAGTPAGYGS